MLLLAQIVSGGGGALAYLGGNSNAIASAAAVGINYTNTTGNLMVLIVTSDASGAALSAEDDNLNTYTQITPTRVTSGLSIGFFFCNHAIGSNQQIRGKSSPSGNLEGWALEYTGASGTPVGDGTNAASGSGTVLDSGALVTTQPNDLLVAFLGPASGTLTPGGGYTLRASPNSFGDSAEDQVVSATGTYHATATSTGSGGWLAAIAALKIG